MRAGEILYVIRYSYGALDSLSPESLYLLLDGVG